MMIVDIILGLVAFFGAVLVFSLFMVCRITWLNSLNSTQQYKRTLKKNRRKQ